MCNHGPSAFFLRLGAAAVDSCVQATPKFPSDYLLVLFEAGASKAG
jgi:hypothetical protein